MTRDQNRRSGQTSAVGRREFLVAVALMTASCSAGRESTPTATATPAPTNTAATDEGLTYPRTATTFLGHGELPPIEQLARYDIVVIDHEWANRMPRAFFDDLHARSPRLRLLAYVNVVDSLFQTGPSDRWRNTYKLWQISRSDPSTNTFPDVWLARTAAGRPVHEWQDRVMTNLTDVAPRVNGQLFVEYAVDWIVNTVWSAGIWDGIYLDVWGDRIWTADSDRWDINRDGADESADDIYGVSKPWERGITIGEQRLRSALPGAILVANGSRTLRGALLNGKVFESFMDSAGRRDPATDLNDYMSSAVAGKDPRVTMTININRSAAGSPEAFRRARFELAATLLQDGFWAPMASEVYDVPEYYDEMDGAGLGRGYLGHPLDANSTLAILSTGSEGVYRRDFDNGIVLVNTSAKAATVALERGFRKLRGTQDPVVNDGAVVNSVLVAPQDAVVLLR